MDSPLLPRIRPQIDALPEIMRSGDVDAFQTAFAELWETGRDLGPEQLTDAVAELAGILAYWPRGAYGRLAQLVSSWVEHGASAAPLAEFGARCAAATLWQRLRFSELWAEATGDEPEPDPESAGAPSMHEVVEKVRAAADRLGLSPEVAESITMAWYDARFWVDLMITAISRREFRDGTDLLPDIAEAAGLLGTRVPGAHWLPNLARVLDDEPLIVLDHGTGRGFRLTMSGIGDNFQLHTLLADRLIGGQLKGLLPGERPRATWVARATDGPPTSPVNDPIARRFRLFDATGEPIPPEGIPADIPAVDGTRVIVLHPPQGRYQWVNGRVFLDLLPALTLDEILPADQARGWLDKTTPVTACTPTTPFSAPSAARRR